MIVSHKYRYIFIKTNKTAGTSVEIALSKFCGPDDIITPISPVDEQKRTELGYRGPQNYQAPISQYGVKDALKLMTKGKQKTKFYNHMSAREVIDFVGQDIWDQYFTFCFERNPWDRIVSLYYWRNKTEPRPTISEFIESPDPQMLKNRGINLYTIDGEVVVDRVCKFENLADDLEEIRKQVGIPEPLELPNAKSGHRKDKRSYCEILSDDDRDRVAEMFSDEIERLGYTWE
ncbi:Sulfotransferase family protein [Thalassoglobus neptunius]|uniref:Sulfotransferase family protein n=1 Tax=Thalassoglobus neptunius TaxID=1938619 RepID=A0A5C5X3I4_9PLAN|nr:sulfotransferase family 2 domain-containing protein [Thalassoglobus neptunius]TWT57516.1 Sulfotransferase family protein [Thalassoglobus neptunius]